MRQFLVLRGALTTSSFLRANKRFLRHHAQRSGQSSHITMKDFFLVKSVAVWSFHYGIEQKLNLKNFFLKRSTKTARSTTCGSQELEVLWDKSHRWPA